MLVYAKLNIFLRNTSFLTPSLVSASHPEFFEINKLKTSIQVVGALRMLPSNVVSVKLEKGKIFIFSKISENCYISSDLENNAMQM